MNDALAKHARMPLYLLGIVVVVWIVTGAKPAAGHLNYLLEVSWAMIGIAILFITYKKFPFSHWVYWCVFFHTLILVYGGYYTYANTPLGNWAMHAFDLARNHYDRIGHLALGLFPVFILREIYLRMKIMKPGKWFVFTLLAMVLGIAAFWELIEWWGVLLFAGDVGQAFLGTQGDIWDAQWDMFLALIGAALGLLFSKWHDQSMDKIPKER